MDKIKTIKKLVDVIEELRTYDQLTRWERFLNLFRKKKIEHLVIDPRREKVLLKRVRKLKEKLNGK